ncbi:MAG: tetratricopeptide repeat protein [Pseudomonadota bacterium]
MRKEASAMVRSACLAVALSSAVTQLNAQELPFGTSGFYLAARHASAENDYKAAVRFYTEALARDPANHAHMENAMSAHLALGQYRQAKDLGARMLERGSKSQIAQMAVISQNALDGKYGELVETFEAGTRVGPLVDGLLEAWAHVGNGDLEAGLAAFDAIGARQGLRAFALHHKALALASAGDFEGAEAIFSGADGGTLPDNRRGLIAYVMVLSQLDRNDEARAAIARVMGTALDATLTDLDRRLSEDEKLEFTMVSDPAHGMAEVFYTVAAALDGEASDSYALLYSRVAESLNPAHVDALLLSAGYLERLERPELATATYDRVPRDAPEFITAEIGRADALRASGRPDAAVEVLMQLAESYPGISAIHSKLGDTLRRSENYSDAIEAYDAAMALKGEVAPSDWFSFFARGISHEREGNWTEAEADFRMALELRPNQPQVLNYLGYSLVEKRIKLGEALELIQTAAKLRPDNGHILDSLGWVLYRLGRFDEAVAPMETAVELMATDPVINDHLGDVYWSVGRHTEAHFQWHRALSFNPEPKEAERIRRKIDVGLDVVIAEEGMEPLAVAEDG